MSGAVLFVAYGGGHMRMLVPVAQELAARGHEVLLLPLTLGIKDARTSGLPVLTLEAALASHPSFEDMLIHGARIAPRSDHPALSDRDTHVYHGMGYADLVEAHGTDDAERVFAEKGRKSFHPVATWRWLLRELKPKAVVATNAPRSESACLRAAVAEGIPSVCVTDHFLVYEIDYVSDPCHGHKVTVLGGAIEEFLKRNGRPAGDIVVTGNPSFDVVGEARHVDAGRALRESRGWQDKTVILWPQQSKANQVGGKALIPAAEIAPHLTSALDANPNAVLVIRPHPNTPDTGLHADGARIVMEPEPDIEALIHASDAIVQQSTTVGVQAALVGKCVITIANNGMPPFAEYGLATDIDAPCKIGPALAQLAPPDASRLGAPSPGGAKDRIADVVEAELGR